MKGAMKRRWCVSAVCALLVCAHQAAYAGALDPANFSVPIARFSNSIYSEAVSRYRLVSKSEEFRLPDTPYQKVIAREARNGSGTVTVQAGGYYGAAPAPLAPYLEDTPLLNLQSPEVRGIARRFSRSRNACDEVAQFVCQHITHKTLGIPLLSAVNVIRGRAGDCTEHTLLTVAVLRAMGIPARALIGMIVTPRFGSAENVFVYHMWAEAYQEGRWILVDATRPGVRQPNRYIAFAVHNLRSEMPLACLRAVAAIQDMTVEYLR